MSRQATAETTLCPFMSRDEVMRLAGVSQSTLYLWMSNGYFPASIALGPNRANGKAGKAVWLREEVYSWLHALADKPRTVGPAAKLARGASQPA